MLYLIDDIGAPNNAPLAGGCDYSICSECGKSIPLLPGDVKEILCVGCRYSPQRNAKRFGCDEETDGNGLSDPLKKDTVAGEDATPFHFPEDEPVGESLKASEMEAALRQQGYQVLHGLITKLDSCPDEKSLWRELKILAFDQGIGAVKSKTELAKSLRLSGSTLNKNLQCLRDKYPGFRRF